jgi:hypothetical protein
VEVGRSLEDETPAAGKTFVRGSLKVRLDIEIRRVKGTLRGS